MLQRSLIASGMMSAVVVFLVPAIAQANQPHGVMHPVVLTRGSVPAAVNSHILYLNRCASGCTVTSGETNSRTSTSDIPSGGTHSLTAYSYGDTEWAAVVACVDSVMAPFNITVTDTDPGSNVDRFEVMIAGSPTDLGLSNGIGGIADYPCEAPGECSESYIPDALVFAFANVYGNGAEGVTYSCGTAAQEIAHAWTLDHATGTSDPMTYNNYTTPLHYRDAAPCGSDCDYSCPGGSGSCNAFGVTCQGSGNAGTHLCLGSGQATQNEVQTITALFGPSNAMPPMVAITSPANNSAQQSGFKIDTTCTTTDGSSVQEVDLSIDGTATATLTATPYNFTAPTSLANGTHTLSVTCTTSLQASATATAAVILGQMCTKDSDCTSSGFVCQDGACVAGPTATGGLGSTCTSNTQCASGQCASDGTNMYCVDPCNPTGPNTCPGNFGCLSTGATGGVCWPNGDSGGGSGGGCNTSGNGGPILVGLGFVAILITRRRR